MGTTFNFYKYNPDTCYPHSKPTLAKVNNGNWEVGIPDYDTGFFFVTGNTHDLGDIEYWAYLPDPNQELDAISTKLRYDRAKEIEYPNYDKTIAYSEHSELKPHYLQNVLMALAIMAIPLFLLFFSV